MVNRKGFVKLVWLASTDDIGVAGYYIYQDGVQLNSATVTGTSFITEAPNGRVVYNFTVIAADAAVNPVNGCLLPEAAFFMLTPFLYSSGFVSRIQKPLFVLY
jgi:hypothetical protein